MSDKMKVSARVYRSMKNESDHANAAAEAALKRAAEKKASLDAVEIEVIEKKPRKNAAAPATGSQATA